VVQVIDRVDIGNGVHLEFVHQGHGTGVPIVCLHGGTDSWRSFEPVLAALSPDIEAFALSQRGHGDSDRPESGYEIENLARDAAAFMRAQGIVRAVIVGHSMGSIVAQQMAIDFPELVSGLILLGSLSNLAGNTDVQTFYEEAIRPLGDVVDPEMAREFQESTLAVPIDPLVLETMIAECLKVPARVWKAAFAGFIDVNLIPELAKVDAPALILWGTSDNFGLRAEQDAIAAALPASKLVVYPGHGHALHWEEPLLIAAAIEEFVAQFQV
jgi:pimeloyl-ACP methyl ester carboxylesterase